MIESHTLSDAQFMALRAFLHSLSCEALYEVGPHFTCNETNDFVEFLAALGEPEAALSLLEGHAEGGDESRAEKRNHAALLRRLRKEVSDESANQVHPQEGR